MCNGQNQTKTDNLDAFKTSDTSTVKLRIGYRLYYTHETRTHQDYANTIPGIYNNYTSVCAIEGSHAACKYELRGFLRSRGWGYLISFKNTVFKFIILLPHGTKYVAFYILFSCCSFQNWTIQRVLQCQDGWSEKAPCTKTTKLRILATPQQSPHYKNGRNDEQKRTPYLHLRDGAFFNIIFLYFGW